METTPETIIVRGQRITRWFDTARIASEAERTTDAVRIICSESRAEPAEARAIVDGLRRPRGSRAHTAAVRALARLGLISQWAANAAIGRRDTADEVAEAIAADEAEAATT